MKTFFCVLALTSVTSSPARALEQSQLQTFATCAGRLSAAMEYQWMFDGEASEVTERRRTSVLELVAATMTPEMGRQVLNWRVAGKRAQYVLLTRATFNDDPEDAAWAEIQATQFERACTELLLS